MRWWGISRKQIDNNGCITFFHFQTGNFLGKPGIKRGAHFTNRIFKVASDIVGCVTPVCYFFAPFWQATPLVVVVGFESDLVRGLLDWKRCPGENCKCKTNLYMLFFLTLLYFFSFAKFHRNIVHSERSILPDLQSSILNAISLKAFNKDSRNE